MDSFIPRCQPAFFSVLLTMGAAGVSFALMSRKENLNMAFVVSIALAALLQGLFWIGLHQYLCDHDRKDLSSHLLAFRILAPIVLGVLVSFFVKKK